MSRTLVTGYAGLRIAYAMALLAAPGRTAGPWLGKVSGEPGATVAIRGLGIRDLVLSAGALGAAATGHSARHWLAACAVSDAVDLAATLAADGARLPSKSKPGTAAAAGTFGVVGALLARSEGPAER